MSLSSIRDTAISIISELNDLSILRCEGSYAHPIDVDDSNESYFEKITLKLGSKTFAIVGTCTFPKPTSAACKSSPGKRKWLHDGCNSKFQKIRFEDATLPSAMRDLVTRITDDDNSNVELLRRTNKTGYKYVTTFEKNSVVKFRGYLDPNSTSGKGQRKYQVWTSMECTTARQAALQVIAVLKKRKPSATSAALTISTVVDAV